MAAGIWNRSCKSFLEFLFETKKVLTLKSRFDLVTIGSCCTSCRSESNEWTNPCPTPPNLKIWWQKRYIWWVSGQRGRRVTKMCAVKRRMRRGSCFNIFFFFLKQKMGRACNLEPSRAPALTHDPPKKTCSSPPLTGETFLLIFNFPCPVVSSVAAHRTEQHHPSRTWTFKKKKNLALSHFLV